MTREEEYYERLRAGEPVKHVRDHINHLDATAKEARALKVFRAAVRRAA